MSGYIIKNEWVTNTKHLLDRQPRPQKKAPKQRTSDTFYEAYKKRIPGYDTLGEDTSRYQFIVKYSSPPTTSIPQPTGWDEATPSPPLETSEVPLHMYHPPFPTTEPRDNNTIGERQT